MFRAYWSLRTAGLAALVGTTLAAALAIGCGGTDCEGEQCSGGATSSKTGGIGSDDNGGETAGGSETGDGSGGEPEKGETADDPACIPSAAQGAVKDACGIFVKAGSVGGDGSKTNPFGTLTEAIAPADKS